LIVGAAMATAGAMIAQADATKSGAVMQGGGLAVENGAKIERPAAPGAANLVKVENRSAKALAVEVAARPWTQSSSGQVSPNRRTILHDVAISEPSFTLAPGMSKDVKVTLTTGASQYGALEVVGLPTDIAKRKGIVTGYRIVGALRYTPTAPTYTLQAGAAKIKSGMLTLRVTSRGNSVSPVGGDVRLKGPLGTRQGAIKSVRLLPGKTIALDVVSVKGLQAGRYTATVSLKQGTFRTTVTKKVTVKR